MDIKKIAAPIFIALLSVAFLFVVFIVYLTKGKSGFWISKKMLIGSVLISLTSIFSQSCGRGGIGTSCYDPALPNQIQLDSDEYSSSIDINLAESNKLTGILYDRIGSDFSFNITDTLSTDTLQIGNIIPSDGKFDESTEDISLELNKDLPKGKYLLNLYATEQSEQFNPILTYRLNVKNQD